MKMSKLIFEAIDHRFVRLVEPFIFESKIVGRIEIPIGFVCDLESVPIIRGTSKRGGVAHDYLCRIDSCPVVTKKIAANVYLEVMASRNNSWLRRYIKYWVVRWAWGYFHKLSTGATYEKVKAAM